jgi:acyl-CoA synthetase (NDP forming)
MSGADPEKPSRGVYTHAQLARLFNPQSVAVFGASANPQSFGARTIANMAKFRGRILRINPRYDRIGDDPCYPSVAALPEAPDCALLCVPREHIEAALLDCAARGVGGAVVFASGYAETGLPEHAADQARITAIARETGLKIVGPNCLGFVNFPLLAMMSFASGEMEVDPPRGPGIGIVSQSGALGFALGQAERRGMNLSHVLTFGNGADVNIADEIAFLAEDPACAVIACLFEGMPNPLQLLEAGELARRAGKPVVICKLGQGKDAATAALSHTGSLAGSTEAYLALFRRAGFVVVPAIGHVMQTAAFFGKFARLGPPRSRGVAVIGASGGALIAATDAAETFGVPMPQLPDDMKARLRPFVPEFGALRNPCDLTAMFTRDNTIAGKAVEAMLTGDTFGAIVVPHTTLSQGSVQRARGMAAAGERMGKPVCFPYAGGWIGGPSTAESEADPNIACFQSIERCFETLAAWHDYHEMRSRPESSRPGDRSAPAQAAVDAGRLIDASPNTTLTEREAKAVLAVYGVSVVQEHRVSSAAQAVSAARAAGGPVALKLESPDVPHKTDAGVIRLNVSTDAGVEAAYAEIMANAQRIVPAPQIDGVLVQPMVPPGVEIMVGARVDPLFGPLIVVGLGGILVELMKDSVLELAPVTKATALDMLARLRGRALLDGFRGGPAVDRDALAEAIVRLGEFVSDHRDRISELDVNPLICAGTRVIAVDALIVRARGSSTGR